MSTFSLGIGSEGRLMILSRANSIDINRIGHISITVPNGIRGVTVGKMCRLVAAQCLIDGLTATEGGITLRNIWVDKDFNDAGHDQIISRVWHQPPLIRFPLHPDTYPKYLSGDPYRPIYQSDRNTDNDRKIMLIYAVEYVGSRNEVWVDRIDFKRSTVRIIEPMDITSLLSRKIIYLQYPILYKKNDDANIVFYLKPGYEGHYDEIKFHGIIGEALGTYW